jgi:H+-translocating NAD(P) transhydrogenase subunit alpha
VDDPRRFLLGVWHRAGRSRAAVRRPLHARDPARPLAPRSFVTFRRGFSSGPDTVQVRPQDAAVSPELIASLTIFALAVFLGFELIARVPTLLHTPLMSGTNAISGIIIVGAILVGGASDSLVEQVLTFVAIVFATVNVVGGFLVTDRMLEMFKGRSREPEQ